MARMARAGPAQPDDPAAWGYAARSPTAGKIWRTTPALANRYVSRTAPFQGANGPAKFVSGAFEPFSFRPDKTLPGTLHHSGNRPAPPSDHIPLARRSAFRRGLCGNSDARAGLERIQREGFCRADARQFASRWKNGTLWFRFRCWSCVALRIDRELTHATRRPTS
jgi:hypothetical protein